MKSIHIYIILKNNERVKSRLIYFVREKGREKFFFLRGKINNNKHNNKRNGRITKTKKEKEEEEVNVVVI